MLWILLWVFGMILVFLGLYVICVLKNPCTGFFFMGIGNVILCIFALSIGNTFIMIAHSVVALICGGFSWKYYKEEKKRKLN